MILDIMLPKLDGIEVCRIIRSQSAIPIIMLSAKKSDVDKIVGLGIGADDYVVKPFSPGEMIARVKAQLRRAKQLSSLAETSEIIRYQELALNVKAYEVTVRNQPVPLSAREFEVLRYLALHPNQILTREQIFRYVWGFDERGDLNTVTVHIKKIRGKIEVDPANPTLIKTVWESAISSTVVRDEARHSFQVNRIANRDHFHSGCFDEHIRGSRKSWRLS